MSQTIVSMIVIILSTVLPKLGVVDIGNDAITTTVSTILVIGAALWAWIRRYQQGDVTIMGGRVK